MTALKSFLYLILVSSVAAVYVPLALLRKGPQIDTGFLAYFAIPLWLLGIIMVLWSFWEFLVRGHGTPAPIDLPRELVVTGLYRYVRNPIYVGALAIFLGHFLWFGYWSMLIYTVLAFIGVHSFIVLYEEPALRRKFGVAYEEYLKRVPRWIPRVR
jgi:protein-S-isoprenylcysteine O-methyltransferase Ste14